MKLLDNPSKPVAFKSIQDICTESVYRSKNNQSYYYKTINDCLAKGFRVVLVEKWKVKTYDGRHYNLAVSFDENLSDLDPRSKFTGDKYSLKSFHPTEDLDDPNELGKIILSELLKLSKIINISI